MQRILTYQIFPTIPAPLMFLEILARNLWWCWKPDAVELFRRIDPALWKTSNANPVYLLAHVNQERLHKLAVDDSFIAHLRRVEKRFTERVTENIDPLRRISPEAPVAYFSMEFGIHESIPIFAGGLGVLAGDVLKAASNMALPMVGVGLLYRRGFMRQYLNLDGRQQESFPETELHYLPVERARDRQGNEVTVSVTGPDGEIHAFVWKIRVGRTPLFLLDTNLPANPLQTREITARLYSGEPKTRLAQEILLGIGGLRALHRLNILPAICHMNEGHSAFCALERLALFMEHHNMDLQTALQLVPRTTVFTTHTPVPAGHDLFPADMVRPYLQPLAQRFGLAVDNLLAWGRPEPSAENIFSMHILGLRFSQYKNAVSQLHGRTARRMWAHMWPGIPEEEIPITHITNGVHVSTFVSPELANLFERHLGPEWYMSSRRPENIQRIDEIYDEELWRAHEMARTRMIRTCREMLRRQYEQRNAPHSALIELESTLDPEALTLVFARRFASYKRAALILQDPDRLKAIINSTGRPVQLIFAGMAHPSDSESKEIIRQLVQFARQPEVRLRMVFVEGYDMGLARCLVQGADIWLNTPRRPNEACGTSGMKAAVNGALNVSILDGWWNEGYRPECGWRIGNGETYEDAGYQDAIESQALYNLLENDVIPCFYEERSGVLPVRWIKMMKASMKTAMQAFCSLRMLGDYEKKFYAPIMEQLEALLENDGRKAHHLASQETRLRKFWPQIRIGTPVLSSKGPFRVGEHFSVDVEVHLAELLPEEVCVQLYNGHMRAVDNLQGTNIIRMSAVRKLSEEDYLFSTQVPCDISGRYGFTLRVTPAGDDHLRSLPGLITWF